MKSFLLTEINAILKGEIVGNCTVKISAPEQLESASETEITFIGHKKYEKLWQTSKARAAIVNDDIAIEPGEDRAFIKVKNADLAMSQVLALFAPEPPVFHSEIHPNATVDSSATIGKGVKIGAGCYIGPNVQIGDNSIIYPNVTVLDFSTIGQNTILWSGVVIKERCHIGSHCIIHPNASIGADGFGFRPCPELGLAKVPQIGNVIIGNYVEIGANSCVDRAKFSSTIVGDGCKIDNLVQIGHNCKLGRFCIMAGNSGLAGSVTVQVMRHDVVVGQGLRDHHVFRPV